MHIPQEFMNVLDQNMLYSGIVRSTVSRVESLIQESKFEFFPEYTKHDSSHVETVLINAKELMGESVYLLNIKDVLVLILSILVHDLGMHITFQGFNNLLRRGKEKVISEIDENTWEKEWNAYLHESKKWSGEKRQDIFGRINLVIKEPSQDENEHSKIDKMFIGEFIRRHHHRIAHEIALFGFPLANGELIPFVEDLDFEIKDIIGFVARSHGMNLRSTFSYLMKKHHDCRTPYNIKAIYLMVVLRISDYIHITPDRAPVRTMHNLLFSSAISLLEWDFHQTVKDMNQNHEDPETLFVNSRPSNSAEFLKTESLIKNIQSELDISWAVLGEVYGRYPELNKLKISIRRLQSNLENKSYIESLAYIPKKARFDSDPEIIKLLVDPLYGGNPSYGVRELLQNSLDACKELNYLYKVRGREDQYKTEIKIEIYQNDSIYYLQIQDNGIGMSADVIIHYFIRAGASYRNSNDWKMNFTVDGATQIARSGRFGVGVLAAFLLGDQIEVTTKCIDSGYGYFFIATLDDRQIEVKSTINRTTGTTIKVRLNEKSLSILKEQVEHEYHSNLKVPAWYAWYLLNEPSIVYSFPEDWEQQGFNKFHTTTDIHDWRSIKIPGYDRVYWKFGGIPLYQYFKPTLLCNGIIIPEGFKQNDHFYQSYPSMNRIPSVVVFEHEGNMPLTLTRDKLDGDGELPFERELFQSLILDMVAKLLQHKVESNEYTRQSICFRHPILKSEGVIDKDGQIVGTSTAEGKLILSKNGYCLPFKRNILKIGSDKVVKIWPKTSQELSFNIWSDIEYAIISDFPLSHWSSLLKNELYEASFVHDFKINSKRIYLPKQIGLALINGEIKIRNDILIKLKLEKEFTSMVSIVMNNPPPATIDDSYFDSKEGLKIDTLIELFLTPKKYRKISKRDREKINAIQIFTDEVLNKCFADKVFIPYEVKERQEQFPVAFDFLSDYM